jgi:hypothetical protein
MSQTMNSLSECEEIECEVEHNPGLFVNINGKEHRVSATTSLASGDIIGMRVDCLAGTVQFDLNGFDYEEVYQSEELKQGCWYPTIDIGTGDDIATVMIPPYKKLDQLAWAEAKTVLSKQSLICLIKLQIIQNLNHKEKYATPDQKNQQSEMLRIASLMMLQQNIPLEEVFAKFNKEYIRYRDNIKNIHVELFQQLYKNEQGGQNQGYQDLNQHEDQQLASFG